MYCVEEAHYKETPVGTPYFYPSFAKIEKRLRLTGHSWRRKSELVSDTLIWNSFCAAKNRLEDID